MQAVGIGALLEKLDALLRERPQGVVASDADFTIWNTDVGDELFERALTRGWLKPAAREALVETAQACGLEVAPQADCSQLGRALWQANSQGTFDDCSLYAMMAWAFAGYAQPELDRLCDQVFDELALADLIRPELSAVIAWCNERKVPFYIVSASPQFFVVRASERLGLNPAYAIAMEPQRRDGILLPVLATAPTYAHGKPERLRQRVGDAPLLAAFGDSAFDVPLLQAATIPVAVYPGASLQAADFAGLHCLGEPR